MGLSGQPEISVILPVYNVGTYLDECMRTLLGQTFRDMEILLINDGSTDDSPARCRRWAETDGRVRVIDQPNAGVASARNRGVREARGKYIAFVDPDDWLDPTYMEKLRDRLEATGADFAECDLWRCDNRSGKKIYRRCSGRAGRPYTLREHMKYGPTATYKSMSRRSLWTRWDVRMPDCSFESPAIYALVLALSTRVESVEEALYYYRRFRENSLIENGYAHPDGSANNTLGIEAMEYLLGEFHRCGLYEEYRDTLEGVVKYRLNDILAMQFHRKDPRDYGELSENCRRFLGRTFPNGHNEPYVTWGGYNLNRVLTHMNWLHDPAARFNFSSIVSVCAKAPELPPLCHKNRYRQIMLERERTRFLWELLPRLQPRYMFLDLMEERFDFLDFGGAYMTKSDALDGAEGVPAGVRIVERFSAEAEALWRHAAAQFVERVRAAAPGIRFVILEDYLTGTVGDVNGTVPFLDGEAIARDNALLESRYAWLESLCPEAAVLSVRDDPLFFTDKDYEYGAIPSHYNELLNEALAARIGTLLRAQGE